MNDTQVIECGNTHPHTPHVWNKIWDGWRSCPGHDRPFAPAPKTWDCCEGYADLCQLHAAAPTLLEALSEIADAKFNHSQAEYSERVKQIARDAIAKAKLQTYDR